jgi:hypothetical protein
MTGSTRYWIDRDPDGSIAHLVRIREVPYEGLWAEFFRKGRWYRNNAAVRYLMDPLLGDEISEEEAKEAASELGYEWLGEPASLTDDEAEPPPDGLSLTEVAEYARAVALKDLARTEVGGARSLGGALPSGRHGSGSSNGMQSEVQDGRAAGMAPGRWSTPLVGVRMTSAPPGLSATSAVASTISV